MATEGSDKLDKIIKQFSAGHATDREVADLARRLAESGDQLGKAHVSADVASTGGPTSLSTLLTPLFLRGLGANVPKLGVPGRPAGGIDVLAQIPEFQYRLTLAEVRKCLEKSGYAHFIAGNNFAPLDAALFVRRQAVGAQDVPTLASASLLSKKVALGIGRVGLDVRVGRHGNFGRNWEDARQNADQFIRAASILGISAVCILTDAESPYQPYVGRGEALVALHELLYGKANPVLLAHAKQCSRMAAVALQTKADASVCSEKLRTIFEQNLVGQGASVDAFLNRVLQVTASQKKEFKAKRAGYLKVEMGRLRDVFSRYQRVNSEAEFPDDFGLVFQSIEKQVNAADVVALVRCADNKWQEIEKELNDAILIAESPTEIRNEEVING